MAKLEFSKGITMHSTPRKMLDKALEIKNRAKSLPCPTCIDYGSNLNCRTCKGMGTMWMLSHKDFSNLGVQIVKAIHVKYK